MGLLYQWIQFHRSCVVDASARFISPIVRATLLLLIGLGLVDGELRYPRRVLELFVLFLAGAGGVELLKTGIERLRPNFDPDDGQRP